MQLKELYKVRKTVLEMVEDRGYKIPDDHANLSYEDFVTTGLYDILFENNEGYLYVNFHNVQNSFGISDLVSVKEKVLEKTGNHETTIIVIVPNNPTSLKKELVKPKYSMVNIFIYNNLKCNIARHKIQPKFKLLSKEEDKKRVLDMYSSKQSQLYQILIDDPISKYFGAHKGDIFEVKRKDITVYRSVK